MYLTLNDLHFLLALPQLQTQLEHFLLNFVPLYWHLHLSLKLDFPQPVLGWITVFIQCFMLFSINCLLELRNFITLVVHFNLKFLKLALKAMAPLLDLVFNLVSTFLFLLENDPIFRFYFLKEPTHTPLSIKPP